MERSCLWPTDGASGAPAADRCRSLVVTVTVTDCLPTGSSEEDRDTVILIRPIYKQRFAILAEHI